MLDLRGLLSPRPLTRGDSARRVGTRPRVWDEAHSDLRAPDHHLGLVARSPPPGDSGIRDSGRGRVCFVRFARLRREPS